MLADSITFTTVPPTLSVVSSILDDAVDVALTTTTMTFTYSNEIEDIAITGTLDATVVLNAAKKVATVTITEVMLNATEYHVISTVTDAFGQELVTDISFTTVAGS
jgi:hypothetical protein